MDTDWVLHDFKTSSRPYDPRKADRTQLVIYAWACQQVFGRLPKSLCFDVFVKGDGGDGFVGLQDPVVFPVPSPSEISQVARKLEGQIEKVHSVQSAGDFPRSFMPLRCHWCEYQSPCQQEWEDLGRPPPVRIALDSLV
jgi:hypothetical protein